jgi:predicted lysophospholipase L1 biosynthesis ABC-type transport system permease subunit
VGRWIEWASGDRGTVIGVVEDVRQLGLHLPAAAEVYLAWARAPASQALIQRTGVEPADGIWPVAQAEIEAALPAIRVRDVQTAQELVIGSYASRRLLASVSGAWAVIALLLGGLGVFSLVQHGVRRRRREAAVRMACGARPSQVATLLTRSGLLPAALGAAVGLALAALAARGISAQLYGVAALDAASHLGALGLLLAAAWVAAALPARKAARTDPARELRSD